MLGQELPSGWAARIGMNSVFRYPSGVSSSLVLVGRVMGMPSRVALGVEPAAALGRPAAAALAPSTAGRQHGEEAGGLARGVARRQPTGTRQRQACMHMHRAYAPS